MPKAIWAAVSGLDNHQSYMDVIGNNLANVNTTGYKAARYEFEDILSQQFRGAAPPAAGGIGGTNPEQVGLGTTTGSIDTITLQGSLQQTNLPTDVAVQGQGYFVVGDGQNLHYTRDSVFHVDAAGNIVSSANGLHLQGFAPNANLTGVQTGQLVNLTIPQTVNPAANTTDIAVFGNLNSQATTAQTQTVSVFDSLGQQHTVTLTFSPNNGGGVGDWTLAASATDLASGASITPDVTNITFDSAGKLTSAGTINLTFNASNGSVWNLPGTTTLSNATQANAALNLDDATVGTLASFAAPTSISSQVRPSNPAGAGNPAGFLKSFTISPDGTIRGTYSTGFTGVLGQVVLATFTNPAGLVRIGQNDWNVTADSGQANVNVPGTGPAGTVAQGNIETSNVIMGDELANMILAERGFQANSRMVSTSDEMLQDVISMKR